MDDKKAYPPTYYSLHADELKLLQFLLYHLRTKPERKKANLKRIEVTKESKNVSFE